MSAVLARWNGLAAGEAMEELLPCCGSKQWADEMVQRRPILDKDALLAVSDEIWRSLTSSDWLEAFRSHPRIGESKVSEPATARSAAWSSQEQQKVADGSETVKIALAEGNLAYEDRFGHIFIVCASGKSGPEILKILQRRLQNDKTAELEEAAEQQRQITQIRLKRWLTE